MSYHIRVRPTALIIENEQLLLIEYTDHNGVHYNLPGGGAEQGETLIEGVIREIYEEAMVEVDVGPIAFVYEMAPHHQSGDYSLDFHTIHVVFECRLKDGAVPRLPDQVDFQQTEVKWIALENLDNIVLYPNMVKQIQAYRLRPRTIELIEDHMLPSHTQ